MGIGAIQTTPPDKEHSSASLPLLWGNDGRASAGSSDMVDLDELPGDEHGERDARASASPSPDRGGFASASALDRNGGGVSSCGEMNVDRDQHEDKVEGWEGGETPSPGRVNFALSPALRWQEGTASAGRSIKNGGRHMDRVKDWEGGLHLTPRTENSAFSKSSRGDFGVVSNGIGMDMGMSHLGEHKIWEGELKIDVASAASGLNDGSGRKKRDEGLEEFSTLDAHGVWTGKSIRSEIIVIRRN